MLVCFFFFFSWAISPAFHGLHSAEDVKNFLARPPTVAVDTSALNSMLSSLDKTKDELGHIFFDYSATNK
jgi:hypothetical protein